MSGHAIVTGASGFIGINLVKELLKTDHKVTALVRKSPFHLNDERLTIKVVDILDAGKVKDAVTEADTLFHCAAYIGFAGADLERSYNVNVIGAANVFEASYKKGVKRVVHLSAASVLGCSKNPADIIDENSNPAISIDNPYAYTKRLSEDTARHFARKGLDISIANITTVYGSGDRKMNSGSIIKTIYKNKFVLAPPGGTSYVAMRDLAAGLILLSKSGRRGESYIFSSENLSYRQLFARIARAIKRHPAIYTLPRWTRPPILWAVRAKERFSGGYNGKVELITSEIVKDIYNYKYYSPNKASRELGWEPAVSLEDAAAEALGFYLKEGLIL